MFHNEPRPKRRRKLALVEAEPSAAPAPAGPGLPLLNRELSWLAFNQRVLDEAFDERWPLLERLKFLCITETNLDEFFMIRVSGLLDQLSSEVVEPSDDGLPPAEALARIRADGPEDGGAADGLPRRGPPPEARRQRDRRPHVGRPHGGAARGRRRLLPAQRPPGPHAARRGPGPPVPVPLEPLDELRRRGEEPRDRRREVRARQGPAGPPAPPPAARDPRGQEEGQAREGRVPAPRVAPAGEPRRPLPGARDRLVAPLPRHARRGHRDPGGRGVRPPRDDRAGGPPPPLRRRRAPRGGPEDAEARPQAPRQAARDHGERGLRRGRRRSGRANSCRS